MNIEERFLALLKSSSDSANIITPTLVEYKEKLVEIAEDDNLQLVESGRVYLIPETEESKALLINILNRHGMRNSSKFAVSNMSDLIFELDSTFEWCK
jgi:hypothetical protein